MERPEIICSNVNWVCQNAVFQENNELSLLKTDRVHASERTELNECNGKIRATKEPVTCIVPNSIPKHCKRDS